jgi:probable F420-dependent oxidoreductase
MLGRFGIWSRELRFGDAAESVESAAELEQLGFGTLWIPGGAGGDILDTVETMLEATAAAVVATGILNVWMHDAAAVAEAHAALDEAHPGRFLLGLGISHAPLIDSDETGLRYAKPLETMTAYLDALDAHAPAGTRPQRVLAALAPKMVELAGRRTLGVHPYMVPVEHTRWVRGVLGDDRLVATELSVVLEPELERARDEARLDLGLYLTLPNYVNTWRRFGFTETDFEAGGSNRLIDALYARGSAGEVADRVREHLDAGASHVCLRVVTNDLERLPRTEWRELASALQRG